MNAEIRNTKNEIRNNYEAPIMSLSHQQRPILVTGSHRSGSTWVGQMIAAHPQVAYIWEPFNPMNPAPDSPVRYWYEFVTSEREQQFMNFLGPRLRWESTWWTEVKASPTPRRCWGATMRALVTWWHRLHGRRPLLKDPIAFFSAEWLARAYAADVVVLIRHPAAFVSSVKRLNWRFRVQPLLDQPQLMQRYLEPFRDQLESCRRLQGLRQIDIVDEAILWWRFIHHVIRQYQQQHTDWIFARHEDLSLEPMEKYDELLQRLDLDMTRHVRKAIMTHTAKENPAEAAAKVVHQLKRNSRANIFNWMKRLTPAEIAKIRRETEDVARHFYTDADWTSAANVSAA